MSAANRSPTASRPAAFAWRQPAVVGTMLGMLSAVAYTATNIFLRQVVHCEPEWVSCWKAVPTTVLLLPCLLVGNESRRARLPWGTNMASLVGAGLLGHLGGNVLFQWSLSIIGMSLTVPLCLGSIILCSAVLGRALLNESVTGRTLLSLLLLVAAIWSLSLGSRVATTSAGAASKMAPLQITGAVVAACAAGLAYAVLGVAIRRSIVLHGSVVGTIWTIATLGVVSLGLLSVYRIGAAGLLDTAPRDLRIMLAAGTCNAVAFLALGRALELTTLVYVNALNATQVAMAAVLGLWLFGEPASPALFFGVALTVAGLLFMPRATQRADSVGVHQNSQYSHSKSANALSSHFENASTDGPETGPTTARIAAESTPPED